MALLFYFFVVIDTNQNEGAFVVLEHVGIVASMNMGNRQIGVVRGYVFDDKTMVHTEFADRSGVSKPQSFLRYNAFLTIAHRKG